MLPNAAQAGPLDGIRIVDITSVLLGPYSTQLLGEYGADVIKVESPEGDSTRTTGPGVETGMAATFMGANRNKRSLVLNLKQVGGRKTLRALVNTADVLICSVRPQKLSKLGLNPEDLRIANPKLVVVGIHGFGESGPYAGRPAYDDIIQALCGLASLSQLRGGEPEYLPTVIADKTCALFAVQAVLLGMITRMNTGRGTYIEVPMLETMVNFTLVEHFYGAQFRPEISAPGYGRLMTKARRPYRTSDGHICVVPYSTRHWKSFFEHVGRAEIMEQLRFSTLASRTENIDALYGELADIMPQKTTREWLEDLGRLDIPAAPVRSISELESDQHLADTGFFARLEDPSIGTVIAPRSPLRVDGQTLESRFPPRLGEHTREILAQIGLSEAEVAELIESGAAIQHERETQR